VRAADGGPEDAAEGPHEEPVGDLGEEAAKLLAVLAGWTRAVDEHVATGSPECQWCPVCRVVHAVRTTRPEVREHLSAAAGSLLQAASSLLASAAPPADADDPTRAAGDGPSDVPGEPGDSGEPGDPGLEHIDLDDPEGER